LSLQKAEEESMKLEDYALTCDQCDGTGEIVKTSSNPMVSVTKRGPCANCGGVGTVLTAEGKELVRVLQFLKQKHFI
jgi:DnaJ-class molecular chaperone